MKKLLPRIEGEFTLDGTKYPFLNKTLITKELQDFVKFQYPGKMLWQNEVLHFYNPLFRWKVRRGNNYLRAFNKGELSLQVAQDAYTISYRGTLYRGIMVSALHALIVFVIFAYFAPQALFLVPVFFGINYLTQIYLSHHVFPMALAKHLFGVLEKNQHENS